MIEDQFSGKKIKDYDFKHPDKFSKDQLRHIQMIYETFTRSLGAILSTQLRSVVQARVVSVDQITYGEFIQKIPNPATLVVIDLEPLKGEGLLVIDQNLSFAIIERLLGGKGGVSNLTRELSDIELTLIEGVIGKILNSLKEAWISVAEMRPKIINIECNPQFVQIIPPGDMIILTIMDVGIKEVEGKLSICMPAVSIESMASKLSSQYRYGMAGEKGTTKESIDKVEKNLKRVKVPLIVELGTVSITLNDIMQLQVGDVVKLQMGVNEDLNLKIKEEVRFKCRPGLIGSKLGAQITKVIDKE
ncbi:MAG: flagellar motor switch protein FliM [bacterium]